MVVLPAPEGAEKTISLLGFIASKDDKKCAKVDFYSPIYQTAKYDVFKEL